MEYKIGYFDGNVEYLRNKVKRVLGYRCFFPAKEVSGEASKYLDEDRCEEYKKALEKSPFGKMFEKYCDYKTDIYKDAVIAEGKFEVIVYSHGFNNVQWDNLFVIENLVKSGYIVFAVARGGESVITKTCSEDILRNSEQTAPFNQEIVKYFIEAEEYDGKDPNFAYNWSLGGMIKYIRQCKIAAAKTDDWSADISKMIDVAIELNEDKGNILNEKMNTSGFGAFGNSLGGSSSLNAAYYDVRIKASINYEGWVFGGKFLDEILPSNALVFGKIQKHYEANYGTENKNISSLIFKRTQNEFMSDMCVINEEEIKEMYKGTDIIEGKLMNEIKKDFTKTFFDIYVKGDKTKNFETICEKYKDEVTLSQFNS